MGSIYITYAWWFIGLCLLLALAGTLLMYYRSETFRDRPALTRWGLKSLRFTTLFILLFLLLSPFLKQTVSTLQKPIIAVLQDASQSMTLPLSAEEQAMIDRDLSALVDELKTDFDVEVLAFGAEVRPGPDFEYADVSTDIEQALRYTGEVMDPQRLSAIILYTDGLYNAGTNPLYSPARPLVPHYIIAAGNPAAVRDLAIKRVFHNKVAYKGDRFSVQLDLAARHAQGERSELTVYDVTTGSPRLLERQPIIINSDPFFETREIQLDANESGVRRYRFSVTALDDERNTINNTRDIYIDVLDARQKIFILADAPHPDISAIRQVLEGGKNYQVEIGYLKDPLPSLQNFDLVVLHQVPSRRNISPQVLDALRRSTVSRLFVLGKNSDLQAFNSLQDLLQIRSDGQSFNEVQAQVSTQFSLFTLSDQLLNRWRTFPPVIAPFGDYTTGAHAFVLLRQKIGAVQTEYPLLLLGQQNQTKIGVFAAEGLWKWRLFDFLQHENHDLTREWIGKTMQYLALKEDKRRFRVVPSKQIFPGNEPLRFDGEFYNTNYELITTPDVELIIRNEEGEEFSYYMDKSDQFYTLTIGQFPAGQYSFRARTSFNREDFVFEGRFSIESADQERIDMQADHDMLMLLAAETQGVMVLPDALSSLSALIRENQHRKPILYSQVEVRPLVDWRWLFGILIVLLGLEWFIRRYTGAY